MRKFKRIVLSLLALAIALEAFPVLKQPPPKARAQTPTEEREVFIRYQPIGQANPGKDTYISSATGGTQNFGSSPTMTANGTGARSIMEFNLTANAQIPIGATIKKTELYLWNTTGTPDLDNSSTRRITIKRMTQPAWDPASATWFKYNATSNWSTPGGDTDPGPPIDAKYIFQYYYPLGSGLQTADWPSPLTPWRLTADVTSLAQDAITQRSGKLLMLLGGPSPFGYGTPNAVFTSSDYANYLYRPQLRVVYDANPCIPGSINYKGLDLAVVLDRSDSMQNNVKGTSTSLIQEAKKAIGGPGPGSSPLGGMLAQFQQYNDTVQNNPIYSPAEKAERLIQVSLTVYDFGTVRVQNLTSDFALYKQRLYGFTNDRNGTGTLAGDAYQDANSILYNFGRGNARKVIIGVGDGKDGQENYAIANATVARAGLLSNAGTYSVLPIESFSISLWKFSNSPTAMYLYSTPDIANGRPSHFYSNPDGDQLVSIFQSLSQTIPYDCDSPPPNTSNCPSFNSFTGPATTVWRGDNVLMQLTFTSGNVPQQLKITIPTPSELTFQNHSSPVPFTPTSTSPTLILVSDSAVPITTSVTIMLNYTVNSNITSPSTPTITAELVDTNSPPACPVLSKFTQLNIQPNYDLSLVLTPSTQQVRDGDSVTYTMMVTNQGPGDLSGEQISVTLDTPDKLTLYFPAPTPAVTSETVNGTTRTVLWLQTPASFGSGATLPAFTATYQVNNLPVGTYQIRACTAVANTSINAVDANPANNCDQKSLSLNSLAVTKTWTTGDTSSARQVNPATVYGFRLAIQNNATSVAGSVTAADLLTMTCDTAFPASCASPPWDYSAFWENVGTAVKTGERLDWSGFDVPGSGTRVFNVTMRTAPPAALLNLISQYGFDRCNNFSTTVNGVFDVPGATRCFSYRDAFQTDLRLDKRIDDGSANGVKNLTMRQGEIGTFKLTATNDGVNPSFNTKLRDVTKDDAAGNHGSTHFIRWLNNQTDQGVPDPNNAHALDWPLDNLDGTNDNRFNAGASFTTKPKFVIDCSTPVNSQISNLALLTSSSADPNPTNNNNLDPITGEGDVTVSVASGKYNLILSSAVSNPNPGPNDLVDLNLTLTNQGSGVDITAPMVTVTSTIPPEFTILPDPTNYTVSGQVITFKTLDLPAGGSANLVGKLRVKNGVQAKVVTISSTASSVAGLCPGSTPAVANTLVNIVGADIVLTKSVAQGSLVNLLKGDPSEGQTNFELRVTNLAPVPLTGALELTDDLHPVFQLLSTVCEIRDLAGNFQSPCGSNPNQNPVTNGNLRTWAMTSVAGSSEVYLRLNVQIDPNYALAVCPQRIDNLITLNDPTNPSFDQKTSGVSSVNVYADQCLEGNIHAKNAAIPGATSGTEDGFRVESTSDIILHPQSIYASNARVHCPGNPTACSNVPFKIQEYDTTNSVGIQYDKILERMHRNLSRLSTQTTPLSASSAYSSANNTLTGAINLVSGTASANPTDTARYLEGRVWEQVGDLNIDTDSSVQFEGIGTIIVHGNITFTGSGRVRYKNETALAPGVSTKDALGLIALPSRQNDGTYTGGNIIINPSVRQVVCLCYAPGTDTATLVSQPANSGLSNPGVITFASAPAAPQLHAIGLFIGRQFDFQTAKKMVLRYNPSFNLAKYAPPGFKFITSPNQPQEGS